MTTQTAAAQTVGAPAPVLPELTADEVAYLVAAGRCGRCGHALAFHYTDDFAVAGYHWCNVCTTGLSCDDPDDDVVDGEGDGGQDDPAEEGSRNADDGDAPVVFAPSGPAAGCPHPDSWFDREICPEPCGTMHDRCTDCGVAVDGCAHEETTTAGGVGR